MTIADASPPAQKSWGVWATIAWVVVADEVMRPAVDFLIGHSPLAVLEQHSLFWHYIVITLSWATPLAVIVVAIRLARWPVGEYLAWTCPRLAIVVLGIVVVLAPEMLLRTLSYALGGGFGYPVEDYRAAIAGGMTPWWYVLRWWPAFVYAPLVEESLFRGFLWRGLVGTRLGVLGTVLVTALAFAAIHYRYYLHDGGFDTSAFLSPFIIGLALGWLRWRSRSTIACMIAHSVSNIQLYLGTVIAAALT